MRANQIHQHSPSALNRLLSTLLLGMVLLFTLFFYNFSITNSLSQGFSQTKINSIQKTHSIPKLGLLVEEESVEDLQRKKEHPIDAFSKLITPLQKKSVIKLSKGVYYALVTSTPKVVQASIYILFCTLKILT